MSDRTVHATIHSKSVGNIEVVRYGRAGKWWVEYPDGCRESVNLHTAAWYASRDAWKVTVHFGMPGGSRFEAEVVKIQREATR